MGQVTPQVNRSSYWVVGVLFALAGGVFVWSYWPTFQDLVAEWSTNPLYSHGYLIPVMALGLLWHRRDMMPRMPLKSSWWALAFLAAGALMRLAAGYFYFSWPDRGSLLFIVAAFALCFGGWATMRWAWPSILFLFFMLPFPGFVESGLIQPLRRISTHASTNVLQTLGFFAHADGNVIVLGDRDLGVVEACSGLRMLSVFLALTCGACFVMQRPIWQKIIVAVSAIPIAVVCNVARISVTGVMYEVANEKWADLFFHDVAGYLMPLLALGLLWLELKFFDLIYEIELPREARLVNRPKSPLKPARA